MVYNTLLILFQNFLSPPHFRRWMQKFMKRWHKHNTSAKDTDNETGNERERSGESTDHEQPGTSSGEEHIQTDEDNAVDMMHLCSKYKPMRSFPCFSNSIEPRHVISNNVEF